MSVFKSFLEKYAFEIGSVGNVLNSIVSVLPLGGAEKAKAQEVITKFDNAAENILSGLDKISDLGGLDAKEVDAKIRAAEVRIAKAAKALETRIAALEKAAKSSTGK